MSDDKGKTDDKKDDKGTGDGGDEKLTAGTLRKWIGDEVKNAVASLVPGSKEGGSGDGAKNDGTSAGDKENPADVRGLVQSELARLKRHQDREARDKDIDTRLAALEKAPEEKTPVERRRVHKLMGWGEND